MCSRSTWTTRDDLPVVWWLTTREDRGNRPLWKKGPQNWRILSRTPFSLNLFIFTARGVDKTCGLGFKFQHTPTELRPRFSLTVKVHTNSPRWHSKVGTCPPLFDFIRLGIQILLLLNFKASFINPNIPFCSSPLHIFVDIRKWNQEHCVCLFRFDRKNWNMRKKQQDKRTLRVLPACCLFARFDLLIFASEAILTTIALSPPSVISKLTPQLARIFVKSSRYWLLKESYLLLLKSKSPKIAIATISLSLRDIVSGASSFDEKRWRSSHWCWK